MMRSTWSVSLMIVALVACSKEEAKSAAPAATAASGEYAAPPANAEKLPSGVAIVVKQPGTGEHPGDIVTVHYTGWTTDGKMFDSSLQRGESAMFQLTSLIDGWKIAIPTMVEGEKARMWIPQDKAYKGQPGKPAGMLVFEVQLIKIGK